MYSDPLQEFMHSEVCHSFKSAYTKIFQHIDVRYQNIIFKIKKSPNSNFAKSDIPHI